MPGLIFLVAGARPNFVKLAPLHAALSEKTSNIDIVHTGQHYDYKMSEVFFEELSIPNPDHFLGIGSDTQSRQTARIMMSFEDLCRERKPEIVVVFGDVNSTLACSIVSAKLRIPLAHVESGLRSFDRKMPEEVNRIVTDHLSNLLFSTSDVAVNNLTNEGIDPKQIHLVGNVMIDTLVMNQEKISNSEILAELDISEGDFDVLTLHRPINVSDSNSLSPILKKFLSPSFQKKVIFPMHPRTRQTIENSEIIQKITNSNIIAIEPLGYSDFIYLISNSRAVWTDSGGIQEETSFLGVPCFTLRENTERPETISLGTNRLISTSDILTVHKELKSVAQKRAQIKIPLWDGQTSSRISEIVLKLMGNTD